MIKKCDLCGSVIGKKYRIDVNRLSFFKIILNHKKDKYGCVKLCTKCRHKFHVSAVNTNFVYCFQEA